MRGNSWILLILAGICLAFGDGFGFALAAISLIIIGFAWACRRMAAQLWVRGGPFRFRR